MSLCRQCALYHRSRHGRPMPSYPPPRMPRYPQAINSLGEIICLGCGTHFDPGHDPRSVRVYCSRKCRSAVSIQGGRLTREDVLAIVSQMVD